MKLAKTFGNAVLAGAALTLSVTGCSMSGVKYGDAQEVETTTMDFGSTDLQAIAGKLVDDMMTSNLVKQQVTTRDGKPYRPVLFVDKIQNKTSEHIDTESITDTITNKLLNSGSFRFVDMTKVAAVQEQMDYQHDGNNVDPSKAAARGKQTGAEYMLYGNFSSIVKRSSTANDVYYKFTLRLLDVESNEVQFSGEKEIRKSTKKSMFGL